MKTFFHNRNDNDPDSMSIRSIILPIIFCLVCGILLILFGNLALRITAYVLSGILILCGIWNIIVYIRSKPLQRIKESRLATGLILLVSGTLLSFNPYYLEDFLPFIWGLALLFGSFLKIQYAFDEKSVHVKKWWIMLILASFSLVIGTLSLLNPFFLGDSRNLIIGIMLVVEAVLDIATYFLLKHALKKYNAGLIDDSPSQAASPDPVSLPASEPETVPEQTEEIPPETEA